MFLLLLLVLWINKNLSSKLLLQCVHSGQIYLTKENIDLPPLDFIKTYLGMKFPICCLLNKNLCSAEVSDVLWSPTWLRASTRGSPVTSWDQGLVLLSQQEAAAGAGAGLAQPGVSSSTLVCAFLTV